MHKHFEIIVNPIAGAGAALTLVDHLSHQLRSEGHRVGVFRTQAAGDAREQGRRLAHSGADAVLVAGGDGTISETIDGLVTPNEPGDAGKHPPLAVLPVGTENLLGKLIGARANAAQAAAALLHGHVREFDVPRLSRPEPRGDAWDAGAGAQLRQQHFLMVVGAGFDAEVVHRLARRRSGNITYFDYLWPILHTLWRYDFPAVRVEADGELLCQERALAFVGNIRRYALGLPICQRARPDDGLLDVVVFKCSHHGQLMLHSLRTMLGRHMRHPGVVYRQARRVELRATKPVSLQVDGDACGQLPVECSISGNRIRLLAPPGVE